MGIRALAPALAVAAAFGAAGCGSSGQAPSAPAQSAAGLSSQAGRVLGGGAGAFQRQLAVLHGTPVVVNQWASWCGPCRFEFPFFGSLARAYRGRVAFLGVDSQDSRGDAVKFLRKFPVPYPTFFDPDVAVARTFRGGTAWPTTAFYARTGKLVYTHPGAFASRAKLNQAIRQYLRVGSA
jgi:thiol-disulfide isomerase/thioredoxin